MTIVQAKGIMTLKKLLIQKTLPQRKRHKNTIKNYRMLKNFRCRCKKKRARRKWLSKKLNKRT